MKGEAAPERQRAALAAELRDQKADESEEENDQVDIEPGHSEVQCEVLSSGRRQYTHRTRVYQRDFNR